MYQPELKKHKRMKTFERKRWEQNVRKELRKETEKNNNNQKIDKWCLELTAIHRKRCSLDGRKNISMDSNKPGVGLLKVGTLMKEMENLKIGDLNSVEEVPELWDKETDDYPDKVVGGEDGVAKMRVDEEFDFTGSHNIMIYENQYVSPLLSEVWFNVKKKDVKLVVNENISTKNIGIEQNEKEKFLAQQILNKKIPVIRGGSTHNSQLSNSISSSCSKLTSAHSCNLLPPHLQALTRLERMRLANLVRYALIDRHMPQYSIHTSLAHVNEYVQSIKQLVLLILRCEFNNYKILFLCI
jgi:hypothetical protein